MVIDGNFNFVKIIIKIIYCITDINQQLEQHLLKQQQLLPKAYITNFHGFCSTLLKQYGYLININSKFDFWLIGQEVNDELSPLMIWL